MSPLYYAHSGLRYLVLFAGVAALVVLAAGLLRHAPYGRGARAAGTAFVVALHLQVLLGVGLILGGIWYPALAGHLVLMLGAAVAAPLGTVRAKRAADPRGAYV
ncbi:MAG: hypothetical protein M3409_05320, partial [Gemmatimonadota bacterium]|nr:hypothetical protein [Gemmatimonadota bacterium]